MEIWEVLDTWEHLLIFLSIISQKHTILVQRYKNKGKRKQCMYISCRPGKCLFILNRVVYLMLTWKNAFKQEATSLIKWYLLVSHKKVSVSPHLGLSQLKLVMDLTGSKLTKDKPLGISVRRYFSFASKTDYEGLAEIGRPILNMGSTIPWSVVLDWMQRRTIAKHRHNSFSASHWWMQCDQLSQAPIAMKDCTLRLWAKPFFP